MLGSIFLTILIIIAIYFAYVFLKSGETPADVMNKDPQESDLLEKTQNNAKSLSFKEKIASLNMFDWMKPASIFSKSEEPRNPVEKTHYEFGDVDAKNNTEKDKILSDLGKKEKKEHSPGTDDGTKPIDKIKTQHNDEIGVNSIPITTLDRNPGDVDKDTKKMHPTKGRNGTNNANAASAPKNLEAADTAAPVVTAELQNKGPIVADISTTAPSANSAVKKQIQKKKLDKSSLESNLERAKKNYRTKKIDEESIMAADITDPLKNERDKEDLVLSHERDNKSYNLEKGKSKLKKKEKSIKNLLKKEKQLDIDTLIEKTKDHIEH